MKKYIGLITFIIFTLTYIWGIKLFAPEPEPPTEGIPHNYWHPKVWNKEQIHFDFSGSPFNELGIVKDSVLELSQLEPNWDIKEECDTIMIKATMYHAVRGQCDDTPDITADQTKIPNVDSCSHLNWIAVSQDLLWFNDGPIRYGDTVYIIAGHKTGFYIVRDAMNKRWRNKIDFLESIGVESYRYDEAKLIINS